MDFMNTKWLELSFKKWEVCKSDTENKPRIIKSFVQKSKHNSLSVLQALFWPLSNQ